MRKREGCIVSLANTGDTLITLRVINCQEATVPEFEEANIRVHSQIDDMADSYACFLLYV